MSSQNRHGVISSFFLVTAVFLFATSASATEVPFERLPYGVALQSEQPADGATSSVVPSNGSGAHNLTVRRPGARAGEPVVRATVAAQPLTTDHIDAYVATYAPEESRAEVRQGIEPLRASEQELSPLFVRFAIELALRGPLTATSGRDLVLRYVEELRQGKLDLGADDMVRAAEIAARESTREGPTPREIEPQYLRGVLVKEADGLPFLNAAETQNIDPATLIDMLVDCGLLNRKPVNRRLQFAYDPVAEHLVAQGTSRAVA